MEKEFLLLANSRKAPGRCIAGIDTSMGSFMRLVSDDDGAALEWSVFRNARPGDIFFVNVLRKAPDIGAQTENWVIDPSKQVIFHKRLTGNWVEPYSCDKCGPFGDHYPYYFSQTYEHKKESLCVITAFNLEIYGEDSQSGKGRNKIDFDFCELIGLRRITGMKVTDPEYSKSGIGNSFSTEISPIHLDKAYLVISLPSSDYEGFYFKFVASIIPALPDH